MTCCDVPWHRLRRYYCRFCNAECINEIGTEVEEEAVCRDCRPYLTLSDDTAVDVGTVIARRLKGE